jgi:hypothetical protein
MYKYKSTCRFKMLVYSGSEIIEVRPQEIISSKVELNNDYLKLIPEVKKKKKIVSSNEKLNKDVGNGDYR